MARLWSLNKSSFNIWVTIFSYARRPYYLHIAKHWCYMTNWPVMLPKLLLKLCAVALGSHCPLSLWVTMEHPWGRSLIHGGCSWLFWLTADKREKSASKCVTTNAVKNYVNSMIGTFQMPGYMLDDLTIYGHLWCGWSCCSNYEIKTVGNAQDQKHYTHSYQ